MSRKKKRQWQPDYGKKKPEDHLIMGNAAELEQVFPANNFKESYHSYWSSPEAFARYLDGQKDKPHWDNSGWQPGGNKRWYGTSTIEEAIDLARNGWKEGAEKASALSGKILAQYPLQRKPAKHSRAGAYPNVARAVAGDPMNMIVTDPRKASRRQVITLLSDLSVNCGTTGEELLHRAAVVAACVDHIEASGYACDVLVFARTTDSYGGDGDLDVRTAVQVKNSNQPVDIQRLAFGLGHPAMFRRMMFAEWVSEPKCKGLGAWLGSACTIKTEELNHQRIYLIPSCKGNSYFNTEESSATKGLAFIVKSLQGQGFPLFLDASVRVDGVISEDPEQNEPDYEDDDC